MNGEIKKANAGRRVSAWLLDMVLVVILTVGFGTIVSGFSGYGKQYEAIQKIQERYETENDIDLNLTQSQYDALEEERKAVYDRVYAALDEDEELRAAYGALIVKTILILALGLLPACLLVDYLVPLYMEDGQTLGKKLFGLAVMKGDGTKLGAGRLAVRCFIGKYFLERLLPLLIVVLLFLGFSGILGPAVLALLLTAECTSLVRSETGALLHDKLAGSVVVDMNRQMIFKNTEEKEAFYRK